MGILGLRLLGGLRQFFSQGTGSDFSDGEGSLKRGGRRRWGPARDGNEPGESMT
jgi:hypothetical protein